MDPSSNMAGPTSTGWRWSGGLLRVALLAVAVASAAAVATARPAIGDGAPPDAVAAACVEPAFALPPGHPPIRGPAVKAPRLPWMGPGAPPTFESPAVVEL